MTVTSTTFDSLIPPYSPIHSRTQLVTPHHSYSRTLIDAVTSTTFEFLISPYSHTHPPTHFVTQRPSYSRTLSNTVTDTNFNFPIPFYAHLKIQFVTQRPWYSRNLSTQPLISPTLPSAYQGEAVQTSVSVTERGGEGGLGTKEALNVDF